MMKKNKRVYDDDDGRTVADMSGVERPRLLVPRLPKREKPDRNGSASEGERQQLSKDEGRAYVFGALGAALLIGAVFAVAFFLFISVFLAIYR